MYLRCSCTLVVGISNCKLLCVLSEFLEKIVEALGDRIISAVQLVSVQAHGHERKDSDDLFGCCVHRNIASCPSCDLRKVLTFFSIEFYC
jgi:hypothetical protein